MAIPKTTYDHIDDNKKRTFIILVLFPITFAVLAYLTILLITPFVNVSDGSINYSAQGSFYTPQAWAMANTYAAYIIPGVLICLGIWVSASLFYGDDIILNSSKAVEVTSQTQRELYNLVDSVAITAGLPTPKIYLIDDNNLNAYATGRKPENASIALTTGLVKRLNRQELEGVIAHEMSHIGNRDTRLMIIVVVGITFFVLLGQIVLRSARHAKKQAALLLFCLGLFFMLYGYLIAPILRFALSRRREYQADATAALITRNPAALASALEKISGNSAVKSLSDMETVSPMCIANPMSGNGGLVSALGGITATHPPIEKRVKALREMDGRI
ncbi:Peptidase family M48 [Elusimicrobium minutum Pei191]|uniref:Peptidase family M48 n=1 Tax=Elusimicrobium minutum (strain Pei191) TaxID=445932 RepID=B2KBB4_ELUMP|nr:M48 family metallopeptidase [Elusimicrobium minutum]ACC97936.1 Peptidase family M48 [Elusimicrobium minutum Pei191]